MADTLARYGPTAGAGSEATLVTGAANGTVVILYRVLNTNTTTAQVFSMSIGANAAATRTHQAESVAAQQVYEWQGTLFLASGDTLRWIGHADLTITGTKVDQ